MSRFTRLPVFLFTAFLLVGPILVRPAHAKPQWLTAFVGEYPSATQLFTCGTCHTNFDGPQDDDFVIIVAGENSIDGENAYARAFKEAGGEGNPAAAFAAIEQLDSDRDGTTNGDEILTDSGFMPGYGCANYLSTLNSPPNLAFFVDPEDPGCGTATTTLPGSTSTTTSMPITTTTTSTSTTLPEEGCAAPVTGLPLPSATDCLFILGAAVGTDACETECLCAPKGSLPVSATDALLCLRAAVGEAVLLDCPCGSTSTSTSTSTTTSTTTSTSVTTSSTTTLPSAMEAGRLTYDARCMSCHMAGSYDKTGFASDLRTKGDLLVANLESLNPMMVNITLSQKEIDDLRAFFASL
jgi:hypothetical protein